jgi:hypothetical protein
VIRAKEQLKAITRAQVIEVHNLIDKTKSETYVAAAERLIKLSGVTPKERRKQGPISTEQAVSVIQALFQSLLEQEKYTEAALLAWGETIFNPLPPEVQRMFKAFSEDPVVFILGAGSLGKSYTTIVRILLDWCRDPENTNWKLVSTSEGHARANTWSTLISLHTNSIVPLPGTPQTEFLGMTNTDRQAAIAIVKIPTGDDGKARLQGFHPLPRKVPHPKFGNMTRVGAFLDEAEKVPFGAWTGVDNMLTAMTPGGHVKILAAWNPDDISSEAALRAEPVKGWENVDEDKDFDWKTTDGTRVLRLDAKYTTNVAKRCVVYGGMQTWEGYSKLENKGVDDKQYWTFGRGMYPKTKIEFTVVSPAFITQAIGSFQWAQQPYNIASFDGAFADGGDDPVLTTGRYGLAHLGGALKPVCLVEQQFPLKKKNALLMMDDLIELLRSLYVRPEHFIMDKTGNGLVFHDGMRIKYGSIYGVQWAEDATDKKILEEDTMVASDQFKNIISEMWHAFARWLEFGYVKFQPTMNTREVFLELTSRKYGRLYRVESKIDYKKRTRRKSPDRADSAIMLIHLCRIINAFGRPKIINDSPRPSSAQFSVGVGERGGDTVPMIDFDTI